MTVALMLYYSLLLRPEGLRSFTHTHTKLPTHFHDLDILCIDPSVITLLKCNRFIVERIPYSQATRWMC